MEPLISVIVPVYKVEPYLRKCIDSILNQTYRNLEVILVDDGSPDNCGAICDGYAARDGRIKVIHKENGGQAEARNAGLDAKTGDYVTFVDADDWLQPELYANIMHEYPFEVAVFGCSFIDEKGRLLETRAASQKSRVINGGNGKQEFEQLLQSSLLGYACNKIYQAQAIQEIRFVQIPFREDLIFNLEVFKKADRVLLSNKNGYFYLQREGSTLHSVYSGTIPYSKNVLSQAEMIFFDVEQLAGAKCANRIVKIYILDFIDKYIVHNKALSCEKKLEALRELFESKLLKKNFLVYFKEGKLLCFFTICYKLNLSALFYRAMKGKWGNE